MSREKLVISIVGARPQFIKAAPLTRRLDDSPELSHQMIHTGQHFDSNMSDVFFRQLSIRSPDKNLGIAGGLHGAMTARMLGALEQEFIESAPDLVIVYGDTNSTLAGALAASKLRIPVCHVEAGLRSYNLEMPEEQNRIMVDHISSMLMAPSQRAKEALLGEGLADRILLNVGDLMLDAVLEASELIEQVKVPLHLLSHDRPNLLVTIHREEITREKEKLCNFVCALERLQPNYNIVWPVHPRTRAALDEAGYQGERGRHFFCEPLGYLELQKVLRESDLVVTDSGGLQKEAYFSSTPCITIRSETEWVELVEAGWNTLFYGDDFEALPEVIKSVSAPKASSCGIYGDGMAAEKIIDSVVTFLSAA